MKTSFKNKKVLVLGLGLLGGGVTTAKWFFKKGAKLRITDLKPRKELKKSIEKLEKFIKSLRSSASVQRFSASSASVQRFSAIKYILGKHRKEDIDWADIVAVNPGVSYKNELVKYALSKNKEVVNDCYLFFKYAKGDIIAITGTRGKTTTTTWIYELLTNANLCEPHANFRKLHANLRELNKKNIFLGGNQPDKSLLKIIDKTKENSISVLELSSFQLEFYKKDEKLKAPKIAIITCLLRDHLNRYEDMKEYALAKANIFTNQTKDDYLILNYDNKWTKFFLKLKPKSQIYFVSLKPLPKNLKGAFIKNNTLIIRDKKIKSSINNNVRIGSRLSSHKFASIKEFKEIYGEHNVYNLLFAVLAVYLYLKDIKKRRTNTKLANEDKDFDLNKFKNYLQHQIFKLKTPPFRQEIIYQRKNLIIVNDSAATTPDATLAAIRRFYNERESIQNFILITGGTDKNLDFKELAKEIKKKIKPENLYLLNGSATKKLIDELKRLKYKIKEENIFESLEDIVFKILNQHLSVTNQYQSKIHNQHLSVKNPNQSVVILFSPASASFEKFKNEFDRGKKFNKLIKKYFS